MDDLERVRADFLRDYRLGASLVTLQPDLRMRVIVDELLERLQVAGLLRT